MAGSTCFSAEIKQGKFDISPSLLPSLSPCPTIFLCITPCEINSAGNPVNFKYAPASFICRYDRAHSKMETDTGRAMQRDESGIFSPKLKYSEWNTVLPFFRSATLPCFLCRLSGSFNPTTDLFQLNFGPLSPKRNQIRSGKLMQNGDGHR